MRRPVRLRNSGRFVLDRRFRLAPGTRSWQRATLAGATIAVAAITLAACGGGSGANLGSAELAANSAATAGNGAVGTAGTGSGSTVTMTAGPITSISRIGTGSGFPSAPAATSTGSNATVPPAALAVTCPLAGHQNQPIPAGFEPVAVVRCVLVSIQPTEYRREIAASSLGPLLTALLARSSTTTKRCLMPLMNVPRLALAGANGQVIEPAIPRNICGGPSMAVVASLKALHWTTVN